MVLELLTILNCGAKQKLLALHLLSRRMDEGKHAAGYRSTLLLGQHVSAHSHQGLFKVHSKERLNRAGVKQKPAKVASLM